MPDFRVIDFGSLVQFEPMTADAVAWWDEHTDVEEFCAQNHVAEHRYAGDIINGILADGLTIN